MSELPRNWDELQTQVAEWATYNFGHQDPWQPMLGLIEEIGEFFAALEERDGNGRPNFDKMADAIADQAIYAVNLAERSGMSMVSVDRLNHVEGTITQDLSERQLIGTLALASHAVLKRAQGIRGFDDHKLATGLTMSLSLWLRWAEFQVEEYNLGRDVLQTSIPVWAHVRKRDWRKNPESAHLVTE